MRPLVPVAALCVVVGCAHGQPEGAASAGLAADHSYGAGDLHHSATDETRLPEGAADNPYAQRYGDMDAEVTLTGRVALHTPDPSEGAPPDDPQDRYVAISSDFPVGTIVRVTRLDDGRSVVVAVRRMEPMPRARLAISRRAGRRLGLMDRGVLPARLEVLVSPEETLR